MKHEQQRARTAPANVLRAIVFHALLVITVGPYAIAVLLWSWLPMPRRYYLVLGWTRFAIWCGRVVCGMRYEVHGTQNLPDGPAIILAKHQSAWETLWLTTAMPRPLCFVYKRELHWLPFFGWALATLDMIHIDRRHGRDAFAQVLEQGQRRLKQGAWIVFFPEGTRTAPGAQVHYKSGGARLALCAGVPIIPIAHNSGELWPRRAFAKLPGTITVSIGPPMAPDGASADELMQRVQDWIESEMHRIAPHRYPKAALALPAASGALPTARVAAAAAASPGGEGRRA
jgi:1-acyl-sn-glycerol-3-phosphate acyltransferase